VQVGGDGHGAAFVGGVDDPVEGFGRVLAGGELADVVDDDELGAADAGDDFVDGGVDLGPSDGDVSDSRVNQATRMPASMAAWARASTKWLLPVPEGPARARFSARWASPAQRGQLG
jgi:hypothetical protein